jgi:hypothetical protein
MNGINYQPAIPKVRYSDTAVLVLTSTLYLIHPCVRIADLRSSGPILYANVFIPAKNVISLLYPLLDNNIEYNNEITFLAGMKTLV